ncbi:MAG: hypothetical protein SPI14_06055 [Arcanobacterium sp.]|nr:hypothetical protein [Arcanobacterium sp.]
MDQIQTPTMIRVGYELVQRLSYEPYSLWRAHSLGSAYFVGWDRTAEAVAATVETLTQFAQSFSKKRITPEPYAGRPEAVRHTGETTDSLATIMHGFLAS